MASTKWAAPPSRPMHALWWLVLVTPLICSFVLQWLPALNGPHLWLGLPTILWWSTVPGSALVTVVLLVVERTRTDDDEQDHLDELAAQEADARHAQDHYAGGQA